MHNGAPVAQLIREKAAADLQDIFDRPTLAVAFATAVTQGLKSEEASRFGYDPICIRVSLPDTVKAQMKKAEKAAMATAETANADYVNCLQQSLSIAALGSIKGVWDEFANPVRDALVSDLSRLGVASPENVVDSAFATHGPDYHKMILSKAQELAKESDERRNVTAHLVETAKVSPRMGVAEQMNKALSKGGFIRPPVKEVASTSKSDDFSSRMSSLVKNIR